MTFSKTKQHTVYKTSNGKRVPGVTTILGVLNKPALIPWANKLGLQGIDSSKYVDTMASIGTCAHYMVQCFFEDAKPDLSEFSQKEISLAENCLLSFYSWIKDQKITAAVSEMKLVSEIHKYGGTCDIVCNLNGVDTLIDIKTGKGIYDEHFFQLAGYKLLLEENGIDVKQIVILRIGRDETEGFEIRTVENTKSYEDVFLTCRKLYEHLQIARGQK